MIFKNIILIGFILIILDGIVLNLLKDFFNNQVFLVQKYPIKMNYHAAFFSYIFIIFALNYFIISKNKSLKDAFLLGLSIYAIFELTNKALLMNWSWNTVFVDSLWGGTLFLLTTFIFYKTKKYIL